MKVKSTAFNALYLMWSTRNKSEPFEQNGADWQHKSSCRISGKVMRPFGWLLINKIMEHHFGTCSRSSKHGRRTSIWICIQKRRTYFNQHWNRCKHILNCRFVYFYLFPIVECTNAQGHNWKYKLYDVWPFSSAFFILLLLDGGHNASCGRLNRKKHTHTHAHWTHTRI